MSGVDEQIQSGSEDSRESDPLQEDRENEPLQEEGSPTGSETSPTPPTEASAASNDSNPQVMPVTNGTRTPDRNPAPVVPIDSPTLRRMLMAGAGPQNVSQASTSSARRTIFPGETSNTGGNAPVQTPSQEVAGESAPGITPAPEAALQASTSEVNTIPGAGELSKTVGGNASVQFPLPEVIEASIPVIKPEPEAEGGNVPGIITGSNAPAAEAAGADLPKLAEEIVGYVPETGAAGSGVPETVSSPGAVGENDPEADSVADAPGSDVPADLAATEAKEAGIPELGNIDSMEEDGSVKIPAKRKREDLKSGDPKTPKSPSRHSTRLQRTNSPSPKKERMAVQSTNLGCAPSDDQLGVRNRGRRTSSTSSNSEMECGGDEVKPKRVTRKDSKK